MQGRAFFERVLAHPEEIQRHLELFEEVEARRAPPELMWDNQVDRPEYRGYQRADAVAWPIYQMRFGERMSDDDATATTATTAAIPIIKTKTRTIA